MLLIAFLLVVTSAVAMKSAAKDSGCIYELDKRRGDVNPMILNAKHDIIYPTSRELRFRDSEEFYLFCHPTEKMGNSIDRKSLASSLKEDDNHVAVKCQDGGFRINGKQADLLSASCSVRMQPVITKIFHEDSPCADKGADMRTNNLKGYLHTVEIGWRIMDNKYIKMVELCIDERVYGTLWTRHVVHGKNIFDNDKNQRPKFRTDNYNQQRYFNFTNTDNLNDAYSKIGQVETIKRILGTNSLPNGTQIFDTGFNNHYIQRGHLSPDADFVMDYQQDGTYYFINVAPQFGAFNTENWAELEYATRSKAAKLDSNLEVTTGTFDTLKYPDLDGKYQFLYMWYHLDSEEAVMKAIPVPKYYWKVIYHRDSHRAAAFLGLNNIYSDNITNAACPSVCDQMDSWIKFDHEDESEGHVTCCSLETFNKVVSFAPDLRDANGNWPGLLGN